MKVMVQCNLNFFCQQSKAVDYDTLANKLNFINILLN